MKSLHVTPPADFRMASGRQKGIRWLKQKTRRLHKSQFNKTHERGYNLYNKYNIEFTNTMVAI